MLCKYILNFVHLKTSFTFEVYEKKDSLLKLIDYNKIVCCFVVLSTAQEFSFDVTSAYKELSN